MAGHYHLCEGLHSSMLGCEAQKKMSRCSMASFQGDICFYKTQTYTSHILCLHNFDFNRNEHKQVSIVFLCKLEILHLFITWEWLFFIYNDIRWFQYWVFILRDNYNHNNKYQHCHNGDHLLSAYWNIGCLKLILHLWFNWFSTYA